MKNFRQQKPRINNRPKEQYVSAMNKIRAQYLAAGVTPEELAQIEHMSGTGDPMRFAAMIALIKARLEEHG